MNDLYEAMIEMESECENYNDFFNDEYDYAIEALDDALESLGVAEEGASFKSINLFKSEEMKNAKQYVRDGIALYKDKNYKEAFKLFEKAEKAFKDTRKAISDIKSWPVSSVLSVLIEFVYGPIRSFEILKDSDILSKNSYQFLFANGILNSVSMILQFTPILGGEIAQFILGAIKGGSIGYLAGDYFGKIMSNSIIGRHQHIDAGTKLGVWNKVQRNLLYTLGIYVNTCAELKQKCRNKYSDMKIFKDTSAEESLNSVFEELSCI